MPIAAIPALAGMGSGLAAGAGAAAGGGLVAGLGKALGSGGGGGFGDMLGSLLKGSNLSFQKGNVAGSLGGNSRDALMMQLLQSLQRPQAGVRRFGGGPDDRVESRTSIQAVAPTSMNGLEGPIDFSRMMRP